MTTQQINARFAYCLAISPYAIFIPASEGSELCVNRRCPNAGLCRYFTSEHSAGHSRNSLKTKENNHYFESEELP